MLDTDFVILVSITVHLTIIAWALIHYTINITKGIG